MGTAGTVGFIHPSHERWGFALDSARHDIYATPGYVLADAELHTAEPSGFLVVEDDCVFLLPLLIRPVVGLGFDADGARDAVSPYGYPGIVVNPAGMATSGFVDRSISRLLVEARARDIVSVFVRLHPLLDADFGDVAKSIRPTCTGGTVSIDLSLSEAAIWAAMRKGHTNAINKAVRAGFEVTIGDAATGFDDLAVVYEETLERVGESSGSGAERERLRRFASLDEARVAVARWHGEVAGAYLFYESGGIVQMHLGGTRTAYMSPSPSHMLIHGVALWAKQQGNSVVHLGGGVGGSTTDGLFTFKTGFSPRRHPYRTLRIVVDETRYQGLVAARRQYWNASTDAVPDPGFFPAYRAEAPESPLQRAPEPCGRP